MRGVDFCLFATIIISGAASTRSLPRKSVSSSMAGVLSTDVMSTDGVSTSVSACLGVNCDGDSSTMTSSSSSCIRKSSVLDISGGHNETQNGIILFDGVCNFCNFWIDMLIKADVNGKFRLCAIQSKKGQTLLGSIGRSDVAKQLSSIVLLHQRDKQGTDSVFVVF